MRKVKMPMFKKGVLIYVGVLVLLVLASQIVLWAFLSSYQKSLPETTANAFLKDANEEYWKTLLANSIYGSPFAEKDSDIDAAYDTYIKDKVLKVRRSSLESKDGYQVFKVMGDSLELCVISLKETKNGSFGMARWEIDKENASTALLDAVNPQLVVYIPSGGSFTVNGKTAQIDGEATKSPYMTIFEKDAKGFMKYSFRAPCNKPSVAAMCEENELKLTEGKDGVYIFDTVSERLEQVITVPEGAEVYVNEVRLTTEYISDKGVDYPFLNPLEIGLKDAPKATVYTVKGLYQKPRLRVVYDGEELECASDNENGMAFAFNQKGVDYTLQVPQGAVVTVNGVDISGDESYVSEKEVEYAAVREYSAELVNPIKCIVYTFKGMMFVPDVKVKNPINGEEYPLKRQGVGDYVCDFAPSEELATEYTQLANDFTVAMMEYMFFGRDMLAETFPKALSFTRKNSKAYQSILDSYAGMYWRRQHTITYNDLSVNSFVAYADNAFMCDIHYDVTGNAVTVNRVDYAKGIYRLLFVKAADGWEVVEFALLDE